MPTSIELRQERARVVEQLRAITDHAESENRNLDATERESYDKGEADFRSLTERIDRAENAEQRARDMAAPIGTQPGSTGVGADPEQRKQERMAAFIQFVRHGTMAPEQRALVENTAGDILVPEDLETEIVRALPDLNVVRGISASRTTGSDRLRRRSLGEVSVSWGKLETGSTVSDSMPSTPTEDYVYVEDQNGLAKIGVDILADTDFNLESYVQDSFSRACADSEETAFTTGTGHTAEQPEGFAATVGGLTKVAAASATAVTVDDFLKLQYAVAGKYDKNGTFLVARGTEEAMRKLKNSNGDYVWQPSVQQGKPNTFLGRPILNQDDLAAIAASAVVAAYGDFQTGYLILDRKGMTVQRLVELYATEGKVGFLVQRRLTGFVRDANALRLLQMAAS